MARALQAAPVQRALWGAAVAALEIVACPLQTANGVTGFGLRLLETVPPAMTAVKVRPAAQPTAGAVICAARGLSLLVQQPD